MKTVILICPSMTFLCLGGCTRGCEIINEEFEEYSTLTFLDKIFSHSSIGPKKF